jgi:uncharacterized protein YdhG (YjbR/CyaY superfamily)
MDKKLDKTSEDFSSAEKLAMKQRAAELKAEARLFKSREEGEQDVLKAIAETSGTDHAIGERLHEIIKASAPHLVPKTWYGMPAYANKDGKVVCFFRPAQKFQERYLTFGFNQDAKLDEGSMWPTSYALTELTASVEKEIAGLVKKAVG